MPYSDRRFVQRGITLSDNKLGGVPSKSREALFGLLEKIDYKNDSEWAATINLLASTDPKVARKRLMRAK